MTTSGRTGAGTTTSLAVPATLLGVVAVIVVIPGATAVATPLALIVATPVLLLVHVKVVLTTLLDASRAVAVNDCVLPTVMFALSGATVAVAGSVTVGHR